MASEDDHKVGNDSVVYGNVQHRNVGDRSVVIGPTDDKGNTILRPGPGGTAIGAGAKAGPYSLSVGAGAGAGANPSNDDEISEEGKRARFARWEELGVDRIKADLLAGGHQLVGGPPAVRKLAWEWVRMKEARPPEVLQLKPTFYGIGIDLKELWRRGHRFLKRLLPACG